MEGLLGPQVTQTVNFFPFVKGVHHAQVPFNKGFTEHQGIVLRPLFYTILFNVPYKFTPLFNLRPPIFGLTLFGWLYFHLL
jgi:hypothetical protein